MLRERALRGSKNSSAVLTQLEQNGPAELDWKGVEIDMPDVTDLKTLSRLAKMTNNAYTTPEDDRWVDPGKKWNIVSVTWALSCTTH